MTNKKTVITAVAAVAVIWSFYIIFHHNPLADRQQEIIKKCISVAVLWGAFAVFARLYDRIIILPQELWANRKLIWIAPLCRAIGIPIRNIFSADQLS